MLESTTTAALVAACYDATMACYWANAAEPYSHAAYQFASDRRDRLVAAVADGNDEIERRWADALFDIYFDGQAHAAKVFADIRAEVAAERVAHAAAVLADARTIRTGGAR